jgi:hypothetical protein
MGAFLHAVRCLLCHSLQRSAMARTAAMIVLLQATRSLLRHILLVCLASDV